MIRHAMSCGRVALLDDRDAGLLDLGTWCVLRSDQIDDRFYVHAFIGGRTVYLHRLILHAPPGITVDHRNGDGLDNQRSNLRFASRGQNNANRKVRNSTGFRGVEKIGRRFSASISQPRTPGVGKALRLGRFDSAEEAARAYDAAAVDRFGEFARLNFPAGKAA